MKPALVDKQLDSLGSATIVFMFIISFLIVFFTARAAKTIISSILDDIKGLEARSKEKETTILPNPLENFDNEKSLA
jgi:hypothetical protein